MFINFSNHPSEGWNPKQLEAASKYGEVVDVPFARVSSCATEEEIADIAQRSADLIMDSITSADDVVMVQGEFTLTYALVKILKERGIKVLSACSERVATETTDEAGNKVKQSVFSFVKFREYI